MFHGKRLCYCLCPANVTLVKKKKKSEDQNSRLKDLKIHERDYHRPLCSILFTFMLISLQCSLLCLMAHCYIYHPQLFTVTWILVKTHLLKRYIQNVFGTAKWQKNINRRRLATEQSATNK